MSPPNKETKQPKKQNDSGAEKPKFDKKAWRFKKYSKQYKLQKFEEKRQKIALLKYKRELKKEGIEFDPSRFNQPGPSTFKKKTGSIKHAQEKFNKIQEEKRKGREEALKRKAEVKAALEQYKKKKMERYKLLSKKTKKGQPLMSGRIQLLYEKIKQTTNE